MNFPKETVLKLVNGENLSFEEAYQLMQAIMSGGATDAQIGATLVALRIKTETPEEIAGFAKAMREACNQIHPKVNGTLVDTCGTGGDKHKTINVSTAAALVISATGIPVAKHGNRAVTSKCGSADILETLGFNISLEPAAVEKMIERNNFGFMFAPNFHPAMKRVVGPRKEIGIRTVFNILGPLTNPANAPAQLMGVFDASLTEKVSQVMKILGTKRAMVVHGLDGLDEISTIGETIVTELYDGKIDTYQIKPEDFGIERVKPEQIAALETPDLNAALLLKIFNNKIKGPKLDIVLLNAAGALVVGGARDLKEGIEIAKNAIESGSVYQKLLEVIQASKGNLDKIRTLERLPCG